MKFKHPHLAVALALSMPTAASAEAYCDFSIVGLGLTGDGWVHLGITSPSMTRWWWMCPVSGSIVVNDGWSASRTVSSDSCKAIYTQLLTAKASGKQIRLIYGGLNDCSAASLGPDGNPTRFPAMFQLMQ